MIITPDYFDYILWVTSLASYILFYPNLWPNPIRGIYNQIQLNITLPHFTGEEGSIGITSHFFYLIRSPEHILPWTILLFFIGLIVGLWKHSIRRDSLIIIFWISFTLFLLSLPAGRKSTKNILIIVPAICLLSGLALQQIITVLCHYFKSKRYYIAINSAVFIIILLGGIITTIEWFPYPQLYTWPWRPDPQTLFIKELVSTGEGMKEAAEFIISQGKGNDIVIPFSTGYNNLSFYYPSELIGSPPQKLEDLCNYDWIIVTTKTTYLSDDSNPIVHWIRNTNPYKIFRNHQIEMVRIYKPKESSLCITSPQYE